MVLLGGPGWGLAGECVRGMVVMLLPGCSSGEASDDGATFVNDVGDYLSCSVAVSPVPWVLVGPVEYRTWATHAVGAAWVSLVCYPPPNPNLQACRPNTLRPAAPTTPGRQAYRLCCLPCPALLFP